MRLGLTWLGAITGGMGPVLLLSLVVSRPLGPEAGLALILPVVLFGEPPGRGSSAVGVRVVIHHHHRFAEGVVEVLRRLWAQWQGG